MAKVLGESGRYVSQEVVRIRHKILMTVVFVITLLATISGYLLGADFHPQKISPVLTGITILVLLSIILGLSRWCEGKMDSLEKRKLAMQKGAAGENSVALILASFPEEFCIINDLNTGYGNLDHVVVGPTGLFVIETKNWKGQVTADGNGELLLNGRPTDKRYVRQFVSRMMNTKDRVRILAPGSDPFFQALFVFSSASVNARWNTTGKAHCIQEEQLFKYVVEKECAKRLGKHEIETIAQAFKSLAELDKGFMVRSQSKEEREIVAAS